MTGVAMDFDFRHLEVFCKVVELGGFSRAAEVVHLAQASVSERIATLEDRVGVRLLDHWEGGQRRRGPGSSFTTVRWPCWQ